MRYVLRDEHRNISAIFFDARHDAEPIADDDPELLFFVTGGQSEAAMRAYIANSDADLLRTSRISSTC